MRASMVQEPKMRKAEPGIQVVADTFPMHACVPGNL